MMKAIQQHFITLVWIAVIYSGVIASGLVQAQHASPALKPSVDIEEISVIGEARTGDTFEILVQYKTHVNGEGSVMFRIPDHTQFPGQAADLRSLQEERTFSRDQQRTERFTLQVDQSGTGLYSVHIHVPGAHDGYQRTAARWIKIHSNEEEYELFDPLNPGDLEPKEIGKDIQTFMGELPEPGKGKMEGMQMQSSQNYNVSVSGRIRFFSGFPEFTNRGVYGNGVVLWFRNSSNPGTWFHPVFSGEPIQGTHFDKLDEQGNFAFNFSFTGDLSGYDEVIVLVNASNKAIFMPAPPDGYISWGNGYTAYYHESDGIVASINPSQTNITVSQDNNNFPFDHGQVYRYMQFSREFSEELYSGNLPFNLSPVYTSLEDLSEDEWAGIFCSGTSCGDYSAPFEPFIFIDNNNTDFTTNSHEYGHYANFRMWNSSKSAMSNASSILKEGWAIMYSFAVRNYTNRNYGDNLRNGDDNTETAPFRTATFEGTDYRFSSIRYAHPINDKPEYAAAACYMWNLYDDPDDPQFLSTTYSTGDNDDISGHSLRVFERMRTLGTKTFNNYHNHFKSGLPSDEQTSVNRIYDFMFDDLHDIPPISMLSAQVDNFDANINSNSIDFTWEPQSYPAHLDYSNTETGYRLYKDTGSGFQLIATIPFGNEDYTYNTSNIYANYKITSYNDEGNSSNAPTLLIEPFTAEISGDFYFGEGNNGTWYADVSGGEPPYSYTWFRSYSSSTGPWTQVGTGGSYSQVVNQEKWLRLSAIDSNCNPLCGFAQDVAHIQVQTCGNPPCPMPKMAGGGEPAVEPEPIPETFALSQNYPNPFNPATTISYDLPEQADVRMEVYNMLGQRVALLVDGQVQAGIHAAVFDASNLSSGTYLLRMDAQGSSGTRFNRTMGMQLVK